MASTNVTGWQAKYLWVKETTFNTQKAAAAAATGTPMLMPVTSDSLDWNWTVQQTKWAGQGRAQSAAAVYLTEIAPNGDLVLDVNHAIYPPFLQPHFAGGVFAVGTLQAGTGYSYKYHTGTAVNKSTSYSLWRVLGIGAEADVFTGCIPNQITFAGNTTEPLKMTVSVLGADGTYNANAGYGTALTHRTDALYKPYVAFNGVVSVTGPGATTNIMGTVKSWTLTSTNNATSQMALDGARGVTDFLFGEHEVTLSMVADLDTTETAKALLFQESIGTAIITYYGSNATVFGGTLSPDLTFTAYFRATKVNTPYAGNAGPIELTMDCVAVDPGVGYSLEIVGTALSGTLHNP